MKPRHFLAIPGLFAVLAAIPSASGADIVWGTNLGAGPWDWNNGTNWTGGVPPIIDADRGDLRKDWTAAATINLTSPTTVNGILADDTGASGDVGITLGNNATAANTLTLAGTTPTIQGSGSTLTIGAVLAGTTAWSKTGAGVVVLNNSANTITGTVTVSGSGGSLQIRDGSTNSPAVFNNLTGKAITVQSGAILDLPRLHSLSSQSVSWTLPPISLEGGSNLRFRATTGSNAHSLAANISNAGSTTINNNGGSFSQDISLTGVLSGSGTINYVASSASGSTTANRTLTLNNTSTSFTGNWFVDYTATTTDDLVSLRSSAAGALGTGSVTLDDRATLISNAANSLNSLSGVTLAKTTSALVLNQHVWSNTGATLTLSGGTVSLGNGTNPGNVSIGNLSGTAGSIVTVGAATTASSLTLNQSTDATFAGTIAPITGTSLSLTKNGASRLTLSNANPFSGNVALLLNNGSLGFGNGATTWSSPLLTSITQSGGSLVLDLNDIDNDELTLTGAYTHSGGGIVVNVLSAPTLGSPYTLVNYGGTLSGTPSVTFQGLGGTRITGTAAYGSGTNDKITVTFSGGPASLVWTGTTDNAWDLGTTSNWLNSGSPDVYQNFDSVLFDDSPVSGNVSPVLSAAITPGAVTFNNATTSYLLTGAGSISGGCLVTKNLGGTTTIATNNSYTGGTDVLGGSLAVGNGGTSGSLGSGVVFIDTGATLAFNRSDTVTPAASTLSGSGILAQNGGGILAMTTAQSFSGSIIGNAGTIQVGDGTSNSPGAAVSSATGITIKNGSVLDLPRLHATGGETITWSLPPLTLDPGSTLRYRGSTGSSFHNTASNLTVSGSVTLDNAGGGYDHDINLTGVISGSGTINYKTANSTGGTYVRSLTLSNASSSYSGNWFVQHATSGDDFGQLVSAAAGSLGTGIVTLDDRAQLTTTVAGGLNSLTGLTVQKATASASLDNGWSNPAGVLTLSDGTISLGTSTGFSSIAIDSLTQSGGSLQLDLGANPSSLDQVTVTGDADFTGGQVLLNPLSNPDDMTFDILVYGGNLSGAPAVSVDAGRLVAAVDPGTFANSKVTVGFTGDVGNLVWKGNDGTSPNLWDNNVTTNWDNAGSPDKFLTFDNVTFNDTASSFTPSIVGALKPTSVTFNNSVSPFTVAGTGSITGAASIVKTGTAAVTLSTSNSFTGSVTIQSGTLVAGNGSALGTTASGTTVEATGTLDLNAQNLGSELVTLAGGSLINGSATQQQQALTRLTVSSTGSIGGTSRWDVRGASAITTVNTGATLTKSDANLVYLAVNTGSQLVNNGSILVQAGTLGLWQATVTGNGSFTVNPSASLALENAVDNPLSVTLAGGTLGNLAGSASSIQSGQVTLTANSTLSSGSTSGNSFSLSGNVVESGGSYGVTIPASGGAVNFNGATSFTGGLSVGANAATATTVTLGNASVLNVASGKQIRVANNIASGTATQTLHADGTVSNSGSLYVGRPAVLNVRSGAVWTQSGDATIEGHGGYDASLNIQAGASFTYSGSNPIKLNGAAGNSGKALLNIVGSLSTTAGFEQTSVPTTGYGRVVLSGTLALGGNVPQLTTNTQVQLSGTSGTLDTGSFSTAIAADISGLAAGASLTKIGSGTLTLNGNNTYTGPTWLDAGILAGKGSPTSKVNAATGTSIAPGTGIGTFTSAGAEIASGGTLAIQIDSTADTADKLVSTAPVVITDALLSLTEIGSGTIPAGTKLTILDYTGTTLTGTFSGIAEGATVSAGSNTFTLSYADASRVTLTSTTAGSPFATWASAQGLDGSPGKDPAFDADPDGDGYDNGLEWILGGNPLAQDAASLVSATATTAGGLTLTFDREEDSIGQATLTVEYDADLAGPWTLHATVGATSSGPVTIQTATDPDEVSVNIPASNAVGGKLFGRLKATQP